MNATYYNENDPYAAQWLRNLIAGGHIAGGDVDERSIIDVQPDDLRGYVQCHFFGGIGGWSRALRLAGVPDDFAVWTGSCPCQPLSGAGQRKGHADERHLWPAFYRLIAECAPSTVFGEQVASSDGREWLAGVRADLEGLGYAVGAADLCAAGVGAPHIRQRLYWVADAERHAAESRWLADESGEGAGAPPPGSSDEPGRCGMPRGMANADGGLVGDGGLQRGVEHGQQPQDGGAGGVEHAKRNGHDSTDAGLENHAAEGPLGRRHEYREAIGTSGAGGLGDADGARSEPARQGPEGTPRHEARLRGPEPGCGVSHWSAFDLIPCTDGKARRVEPGSFPLAHGIPNRVGRLRAYGNAIVPQVAAQFIRATMNVSGGNQIVDNLRAA